MTVPSATVLKDSVSPNGDRVTTLEAVIHRPLLAELNTHRAFNRNSASSRAIPVTKRLERNPTDPKGEFLSLWTNPANPIVWASEQPGMQGGVPLQGYDLDDAQKLWDRMQGLLMKEIEEYLDAHPEPASRLHKSWLNRPLEWFMWHTVVITATEWEGFFRQRATPEGGVSLAQPEFTMVADAIRDAMNASVPEFLDWGEWHLPYMDAWEIEICENNSWDARHVSSARCARTSYFTQNGERDMLDDLRLYQRLATALPEHSSPLEHVCTPHTIAHYGTSPEGNLRGFRQFRHEVFGR